MGAWCRRLRVGLWLRIGIRIRIRIRVEPDRNLRHVARGRSWPIAACRASQPCRSKPSSRCCPRFRNRPSHRAAYGRSPAPIPSPRTTRFAVSLVPLLLPARAPLERPAPIRAPAALLESGAADAVQAGPAGGALRCRSHRAQPDPSKPRPGACPTGGRLPCPLPLSLPHPTPFPLPSAVRAEGAVHHVHRSPRAVPHRRRRVRAHDRHGDPDGPRVVLL